MGVQPIWKDSIVVNENCVTSVITALMQTDFGAWCKRALTVRGAAKMLRGPLIYRAAVDYTF